MSFELVPSPCAVLSPADVAGSAGGHQDQLRRITPREGPLRSLWTDSPFSRRMPGPKGALCAPSAPCHMGLQSPGAHFLVGPARAERMGNGLLLAVFLIVH